MTDTEYNKFLTLLMGECWHEWEDDGAWNVCKLCGEKTRLHNPVNPDHLSNPYPVIKWMEKEMPEEWDAYLFWIEVNSHMANFIPFRSTVFNKQLDLRNLVDYLYEHQEWGILECPNCNGYGVLEGFGEPEFYCQECGVTGKIIHPALQYLKEVKR